MNVTKIEGMRVPLKNWAVEAEAGAIEQATNLTRLPFALHHVALMPDAHQGYGMPIGGVFFADRAVVPYAPDRSKVVDESSFAYKDIEAVMAASTDLVTPTLRLLPLGVVKG